VSSSVPKSLLLFDFDLGGNDTPLSRRASGMSGKRSIRGRLPSEADQAGKSELSRKKAAIPTFQEFQAQFDAWIDAQHAGKPGRSSSTRATTQSFWNLSRWRDLALDRIDEAVIERFKFWALRKVDELRSTGISQP